MTEETLRLANGATVLRFEWIEREPKDGSLPWGIVLAVAYGLARPCVTWVFCRDESEGDVHCIWGHHYDNPVSAMIDYDLRVKYSRGASPHRTR
jgi:hypothetical protein